MKKPAVRNEAVPFEFEELFFSTTDTKGIIRYGNTVFMRISGYPVETMLRAPHNIIRHPDMPSSVFKLFWDVLKTDSPIAAYVKNLSADGRYYWVFAFAFPVEDGYLSIRFKPSSEIFSVVEEVYAEVLKKEKASSMEEGETLLMKMLQRKGFDNYQDFMVTAAITELKARENHLATNEKSVINRDPAVGRITEITKRMTKQLNQSFDNISIFEEGSKSFRGVLSTLKNEFHKLKFLSVNMNILAVKFGESAATLSVISEEFSRLAGQIENQITTFANFSDNLADIIKHGSLNIMALKIQMIMVDFFVKESIHNLETMDNAFDGMLENKRVFISLFNSTIAKLESELSKLKSEMVIINDQLLEVKKLVRAMEIIKQTGAIESARKDEIKSSFNVYLQEMDAFLNLLRQSINELVLQKMSIGQNAVEFQDSAEKIKGNIENIFEMAMMKSR